MRSIAGLVPPELGGRSRRVSDVRCRGQGTNIHLFCSLLAVGLRIGLAVLSSLIATSPQPQPSKMFIIQTSNTDFEYRL